MITDHNRGWYLFKKSFDLFPYRTGAPPVLAAKAISPFYARLFEQAGPLRRMQYRINGPLLKFWFRYREGVVAKKHNIPAAEMAEAAKIARAHCIDPNEVLINHIDETRAAAYIRRFEEATISRRIAPQYWADDCVLQDKIQFSNCCHEAGLPHPDLLAFARDGEITVNAPPKGDRIFVKPAGGTGGVGAQIIDMTGVSDLAALKAKLEAAAGTNVDWLAQDLLTTHPALKDIALNALSTMRIVTLLNEEGAPELVAASYKCATSTEAIVDNAASAGFRIGVDPATGVLRKGAAKKDPHEYAVNPANGAQIEGVQLPFFEEAKAVALAAHGTAAFAVYPYAGWDVAITADGPILIEGNPKATMTSAQRPGLMVMAPERFVGLIGMHLDRVS